MKSLVEKAQAHRMLQGTQREFSKQELDLALAWANGEVTITQVAHVFGHKSRQASYPFLARALRQIIRDVNGKK